MINVKRYRRIRDLREDADLTQRQVGEAINVPQRTYAYYESGERMLPPHVLCALADFYGVSVDYLLERTDIIKVYSCGDRDAVKEAYNTARLEKGFLEMQQYPEGFSVFLPENPSEYAADSEEGMFYLVIRAENASEGITVTATLVDENWDPVQE